MQWVMDISIELFSEISGTNVTFIDFKIKRIGKTNGASARKPTKSEVPRNFVLFSREKRKKIQTGEQKGKEPQWTLSGPLAWTRLRTRATNLDMFAPIFCKNSSCVLSGRAPGVFFLYKRHSSCLTKTQNISYATLQRQAQNEIQTLHCPYETFIHCSVTLQHKTNLHLNPCLQ